MGLCEDIFYFILNNFGCTFSELKKSFYEKIYGDVKNEFADVKSKNLNRMIDRRVSDILWEKIDFLRKNGYIDIKMYKNEIYLLPKKGKYNKITVSVRLKDLLEEKRFGYNYTKVDLVRGLFFGEEINWR